MSRYSNAEVYVRLSAKRADDTTVSIDHPLSPDLSWSQVIEVAMRGGDLKPHALRQEFGEIGIEIWSEALSLRTAFQKLYALQDA